MEPAVLPPAIQRILDKMDKYRWSGLPLTGDHLHDWKITPPPKRLRSAAEFPQWLDAKDTNDI